MVIVSYQNRNYLALAQVPRQAALGASFPQAA